MTTDRDIIPVRLPSGTKAIVDLPRPFTREDATHLIHFLAEYIEERVDPKAAAIRRLAEEQEGQG